MNCCINCFNNQTLHSTIHSEDKIGDCNICNSKKIHIYKTNELSDLLLPILDLYEASEDGTSIHEAINIDFNKNFFSENLNEEQRKNLIMAIIGEDVSLFQNILDKNVKLKETTGESSELLEVWNNFSIEIKSKNRFHFENKLDLKKLENIFRLFPKKITRGKLYYRARISKNKDGYPKDQLGAPPQEIASSGRANPQGISYLYLSEEVNTTLYEVRASLLDYVSIGTFKLNEDINVVNLDFDKYDLLEINKNELLEDFIKYRYFLIGLKESISKSKRPNDSELDYLPIQYITEFIKSLGYEGIYFSSTLHDTGKNLVIFQPELFDIKDLKMVDITSVNIGYDEI